MDEKRRILEILKNEYGISTNKQLNDAIKKQGYLDISVFCKKPIGKKQVLFEGGRI